MKVKVINPKLTKVNLPKVQETKEVSILWCDDGWSYLPQKSIRRKFMSDGKTDIAEYIEEVWPGLVPGKVLYEEKLIFITYQSKLKMWMESSLELKELFVEQGP